MSIRPPKSLFRVGYRMQRSDYAAMAMAMARPPRSRLAFEIAGYMLAVAVVGLGIAGSTDAWFATLANAFSLPLAFVTVPLLFAGPVVLALRPHIAGLAAALIYHRHGMAEREVTIDLTSEGMEGGALEGHAEIGWSAVTGLIETPRHLFVRLSPREALIIPRRAVPNSDEYRNLRGFIRARTGLSTH